MVMHNSGLSFTDMGYILPLLSFYDHGFGIKYPRKVDMPLSKENKPNQTKQSHIIYKKESVNSMLIHVLICSILTPQEDWDTGSFHFSLNT